jgi:hypothetical protein
MGTEVKQTHRIHEGAIEIPLRYSSSMTRLVKPVLYRAARDSGGGSEIEGDEA